MVSVGKELSSKPSKKSLSFSAKKKLKKRARQQQQQQTSGSSSIAKKVQKKPKYPCLLLKTKEKLAKSKSTNPLTAGNDNDGEDDDEDEDEKEEREQQQKLLKSALFSDYQPNAQKSKQLQEALSTSNPSATDTEELTQLQDCKVYLGRCFRKLSTEDIQAHYAKALGEEDVVRRVEWIDHSLLRSHVTNLVGGYGFAYFRTVELAQKAITVDPPLVHGKPIVVQLAKSMKKRD